MPAVKSNYVYLTLKYPQIKPNIYNVTEFINLSIISLSDLHKQDSYSTHTTGEVLYDEIEHHCLPGHEA